MIDAETKYELIIAYLKDNQVINDIIHKYGIQRSTFYKWLNIFLQAGKITLHDGRSVKKRRLNKITDEIKNKLVITEYRKPKGSSYKIAEGLKEQGISITPRTIQRIWRSYGLINNKTEPLRKKRLVRVFTQQEKDTCLSHIKEHRNLGSYRISWEMMNLYDIKCSPMTVRRWREVIRPIKHKNKPQWIFYERKHPHSLWHGDFMIRESNRNGYYFYQFALLDDYSRSYVGCGIFNMLRMESALRVIIAAIRKWKVIPKMFLFDNGFHSRLFKTFCNNLDIQLGYSRPYHPQTNGKIERAHWDDIREFYNIHQGKDLAYLRAKLPEYLHYRNYIRGHWALKGKPAISRLEEYQPETLLPGFIITPKGKCVQLSELEKYAETTINTRVVNNKGFIEWQNQSLKLSVKYKGQKAQIVSTLNGIKIFIDGKTYWQLLYFPELSPQLGSEFRYDNCFPVRISGGKEIDTSTYPFKLAS